MPSRCSRSPIGSLYHFFPNKDAIVEAIGERYAERMRETNEEAMPLEMAHLPAEELFERVLTAQMRFIERTPAFGSVQEAVHRNCPAIDESLNHAIAGHVQKFLALRYPRMSEPERWASAMVSVVTVHAIVQLAIQVPPPQRSPVIAEGKRMLVAHYREYDRER
jgi:AcrR family transcriptional regulator